MPGDERPTPYVSQGRANFDEIGMEASGPSTRQQANQEVSVHLNKRQLVTDDLVELM
jgi:hypothetical protein